MTLTFGRAPFGPGRGSFDTAIPTEVSYVEAWPRRMRGVLAGRTVVDSVNGVMLHQTGHLAMLLFPIVDVAEDVLREQQGTPRRWTVQVGDRSVASAVSEPPTLADPAGGVLEGFVSVEGGAMDRWFEEDDPVYAHVRDPYHRVDVRSSSRHVVVRDRSIVVAESRRPKLLFETNLPVRFYLPFADVRLELLSLSDTVSECPYKGDGQHWHITLPDGTCIPDAAWSLPHPLAEGALALEHVCFYDDKLDVTVDGVGITS